MIMKLLFDTNALIDYYARREPFFNDVMKLRIAQMFGDVQIWVPIQAFVDAEYILRKAIPIEQLRAMMAESLEFFNVASPTSGDLKDAVNSQWPDAEDYLVYSCAKRVRADCIVTRNIDGFAESKIKALSPAECLDMMFETQGLRYDEIDF